ncbi:hypothetical protein RchiOBHm_Chr3g0493751 [Rosa chinensis]|uniref:Uncharacterized protein n=1 Tax=Rosa chinensis TaxID=74649 RepID=A0A2P6RGW0_ROSCH|nr:hypothetical protein RchiOBHm_Chr3g0493751 [Rosa chinensis]
MKELCELFCELSKDASIYFGKAESTMNISYNLCSFAFFLSCSNIDLIPASRLALKSSCSLFCFIVY